MALMPTPLPVLEATQLIATAASSAAEELALCARQLLASLALTPVFPMLPPKESLTVTPAMAAEPQSTTVHPLIVRAIIPSPPAVRTTHDSTFAESELK